MLELMVVGSKKDDARPQLPAACIDTRRDARVCGSRDLPVSRHVSLVMVLPRGRSVPLLLAVVALVILKLAAARDELHDHVHSDKPITSTLVVPVSRRSGEFAPLCTELTTDHCHRGVCARQTAQFAEA
jgi:hypothetical protein